jgi:hypothetical protein
VKRTLLPLVWIVAIAGAVTTSAHHSFAAYYFESESVTIEGEVEEFQFRSPHAILMLRARTPEGAMATYAAEWGNPRRLGSQGINKDTLKPGDAVIVTGSPGRVAAEYKVHLKAIRRPADGWSYPGSRRR